MTANDSQSLLAAMHNTANLDRTTRPPHPSEFVQWGSRLAGGILTLITIAAAGWRSRGRSSIGIAVSGMFDRRDAPGQSRLPSSLLLP